MHFIVFFEIPWGGLPHPLGQPGNVYYEQETRTVRAGPEETESDPLLANIRYEIAQTGCTPPWFRGVAFTSSYTWWGTLCCVRKPSMKPAVFANVNPSYLQLPCAAAAHIPACRTMPTTRPSDP